MTQPSGLALTGAQHDITAGDYHATITELGAGLRRLNYRGRPVIVGYEAGEMPPARGAPSQRARSEPAAGNAIHGLTRWHNWAVAEHETGLVELRHVLYGQPG